MEVPTWQQIITLGGIFALIMTIRYWMIEKSKQIKKEIEEKQIIKELLHYLKEYPFLYDLGLCFFIVKLNRRKIISEKDYLRYESFIRNNHPHKKFPKEFPIYRAYWFSLSEIESLQLRIDYLNRLLNE